MVPETPQQGGQLARLFDAVSETYDAVGVDFFAPVAASLVRHLPPRAGESWLDVGCGRGAVIQQVADAIGPGGRVLGTDFSEGMVRQARRAVAASEFTNVEIVVDDAQDPQVALGSFTTLSSSLVLFFLPAPDSALRRWLPLLTPGGRLGITTFGPMDERWMHVDAVFEPYLPDSMRDARTTGAKGPFGSDEGMEGLVSDAGFSGVRSATDVVEVTFASAEQWHDFTWSVGQRAMWLAVPEDERASVRAEAERRLALVAAPDGSVTFRQAIRHTLAERPAG